MEKSRAATSTESRAAAVVGGHVSVPFEVLQHGEAGAPRLADADLVLFGRLLHLLHPCKGKVPIYIAASGPRMLELSGRIADGIIVLVGVADDYIAHAQEKIAEGANAAGRRLEDINLVLWVPCAVSDTANAKDAAKAHVARVVAHPLPYVLDPNEQKVLEEIRKTYDYYHHMDQQANHAEVIPDWLVDKFAIAGTVAECKAQIERIKRTNIQQIAIIPYSPPGGSREETIRGFAKAMQ